MLLIHVPINVTSDDCIRTFSKRPQQIPFLSHLFWAIAGLCVLVSSQAFGQRNNDAALFPAIGGYSPVSYFTQDKAELGRPEYAVEHDGKVYLLTNASQVALFESDPDKYRPLHESCAFSLAFGMVLPLDPTNFKVIGDSLLLFHRSEEKDALIEWNDSDLSEDELLRRAEANAFRIRF